MAHDRMTFPAAAAPQHASSTVRSRASSPTTRRSRTPQLDDASRALAARLVAAGVGKGARVGLLAPNGIEWAVIAAAVLRVGGVLVPLSTLLRPPELEAQLRVAGVTHLVRRALVPRTFVPRRPRSGRAGHRRPRPAPGAGTPRSRSSATSGSSTNCRHPVDGAVDARDASSTRSKPRSGPPTISSCSSRRAAAARRRASIHTHGGALARGGGGPRRAVHRRRRRGSTSRCRSSGPAGSRAVC